MSRRGAARFHALLLAAAVLGGWVGLPAADILLYHRHADTAATAGSRFTEPGSRLPHGLRCTLGTTCPGPRLHATVPVLQPPGRVGDGRTPHQASDRPRSRDRSGAPQPRAPPPSGR